MKRLYVIFLILFIPSICFPGPLQQAHKKVIAGQTVASEGCTVSDDFSGTLAKWTSVWGNSGWAISSGELAPPAVADENELIYDDCALASGDQWVSYKISIKWKYKGPTFYTASDGTGDRYWFRYNETQLNVYVYNGDTSSGLVAQYVWSSDVPADDSYVGFQVLNADTTDPTFKFWDFGASAPSSTGPSAWGAADQTLSHDDSPATYPSSGAYVGLRTGDQTWSYTFDDFIGGSD